MSFFVPQGDSEESVELKAELWREVLVEQFLLMRDMDGTITFSDINDMTKAERDYFKHLVEISNKSRREAIESARNMK